MNPIWQATRSPVKSNYSIEPTPGALIGSVKSNYSIEPTPGALIGSVKSNYSIEVCAVATCWTDTGFRVNEQ